MLILLLEWGVAFHSEVRWYCNKPYTKEDSYCERTPLELYVSVSAHSHDHFNHQSKHTSIFIAGISTGVFELRADGSFHEFTIFNQYPAGAAKMQTFDDMFMAVRTQVQ